MSQVTNVVLTTPGGTDNSAAIDAIQTWLIESGHGMLVALPGRAEGAEQPGDRYLEVRIWYGGLNYLDFDAFMDMVSLCPWNHPERVGVLANPHDTLIPGLYRVLPTRTWAIAANPQWYADDGSVVDYPL